MPSEKLRGSQFLRPITNNNNINTNVYKDLTINRNKSAHLSYRFLELEQCYLFLNQLLGLFN